MSQAHGPVFADRADAGERLGALLRSQPWRDPVVVGLARGGVPVAARVADALGARLDVAVARKISEPGRPERGVGAVSPDGSARYDRVALARAGLTPSDLAAGCAVELAEARRRLRCYRAVAEPVPVEGRDVVLVDDGLATGVTARAVLGRLRAAGVRRLVMASPVCSHRGRDAVRADGHVDELVYLHSPAPFGAVSAWYADFAQTDDGEVLTLLAARDRG